MLLSFNQWARGTAITARDKRDAMTVVVIHNEKSGRVGELQIPSHGAGRKDCSGERDKLRAAAAHICNPDRLQHALVSVCDLRPTARPMF